MMVKEQLFESEEEERYVHIYYSDGRVYGEKQKIKQKIRRLKTYLSKCVGKEWGDFKIGRRKYQCSRKGTLTGKNKKNCRAGIRIENQTCGSKSG